MTTATLPRTLTCPRCGSPAELDRGHGAVTEPLGWNCIACGGFTRHALPCLCRQEGCTGTAFVRVDASARPLGWGCKGGTRTAVCWQQSERENGVSGQSRANGAAPQKRSHQRAARTTTAGEARDCRVCDVPLSWARIHKGYRLCEDCRADATRLGVTWITLRIERELAARRQVEQTA